MTENQVLNKTLPDPKSAEKFQLYENPDYNFKIKYAEYLKVLESDLLSNQVVRFTIPTENIFEMPDADIGISVYPTLSLNVAISDLLKIYETSNPNNIREGEISLISLNVC